MRLRDLRGFVITACGQPVSIVVQKYGGSSVADVTRIRQVADRVMRTRRAGHDVVVVVSAMGDTTDELLALAKQVSPNPDRRELDMLLTAGERISMALLSMAIRELGGDAISFTGSQSGIITNDRHVDARIIEVRPFRVQDELARGRIVVIAGYQGVSYRREITTLGRGGSDTTAVAMAAALGAEYLRDLLGRRRRLHGGSACRAGGAPHRHAVVRRDAGARRIRRQGLECAGGRIREAGRNRHLRTRHQLVASRQRPVDRWHGRPPLPAALAGHRRRRRQRARRARAGSRLAGRSDRPGTLDGERKTVPIDELLSFLDEHNVAGKQLHQGSDGRLTLVISRENFHEEARVRAEMSARFGDRVTLVGDLGAVSVVGAGINASFDNVRRGSQTLAAAGAVPRAVATSSFRITWMIDRDRIDDAVRALHADFLEQSRHRFHDSDSEFLMPNS